MLIPITLILAFAAGVVTSVPVTAWVTGRLAKLKAFEAKEEAAAKAELAKVASELPKV